MLGQTLIPIQCAKQRRLVRSIRAYSHVEVHTDTYEMRAWLLEPPQSCWPQTEGLIEIG
jgi:hypothetical protein